MRVGIDITSWANPRGYGRYTRGLLTALLAVPSEHEWVFVVDSQTYSAGDLPPGPRYVAVPTREAPAQAASAEGRRGIADMLAMGRAVGRERLDAFFFPTVYTYFPALTRAPVLLSIHDVIAEDYPEQVFPDRAQRRLWALKSWIARQQARVLLTVSEHAREGIARRFGWPLEQIHVVGEAPDPVFRPTPDTYGLLERVGLLPGERFIMCLGGLNPHKNIPLLLQVLADVPGVRLVLTGPGDQDTFTPGMAQVRAAIEQWGLADRVLFTGYLPDAEAAVLLSAARALVLPSLAEGYGLPAVEAAACGTPVIATRNSPLPQLLAGGGWFIDPTSADSLRDALRDLLSDETRRQQMGQAALKRARALTWERAAGQFLAALDTVR